MSRADDLPPTRRGDEVALAAERWRRVGGVPGCQQPAVLERFLSQWTMPVIDTAEGGCATLLTTAEGGCATLLTTAEGGCATFKVSSSTETGTSVIRGGPHVSLTRRTAWNPVFAGQTIAQQRDCGVSRMRELIDRAGGFIDDADGLWIAPELVIASLGEVLENGSFQVAQDEGGRVTVWVLASSCRAHHWESETIGRLGLLVGRQNPARSDGWTRCVGRFTASAARSSLPHL